MPIYQNSSVTSSKLLLGNYKMETSATAAGTYVNMGAGQLTAMNHTPTFFDTQAGNAPDPIEGVADEEATFDIELIEYDASVLSAISSGLLTSVVATAISTLNAGGATTLTPRAFKFTNVSYIGGVSTMTVITVYKATMSSGLAITTKSDNDTNPVNIFPIQLRAKLDSTLSAGSQLYKIVRTP